MSIATGYKYYLNFDSHLQVSWFSCKERALVMLVKCSGLGSANSIYKHNHTLYGNTEVELYLVVLLRTFFNSCKGLHTAVVTLISNKMNINVKQHYTYQ